MTNPLRFPVLAAALLVCVLPITRSSAAAPSSAKHAVVYYEPGRFGGWPANAGAWGWGNELLVGFTRAYFSDKGDEHSYDKDKPSVFCLARSLDGGETWKIEEHPELKSGEAKPLTTEINFQHPDFAMRVRDDAFYVSYDRGH